MEAKILVSEFRLTLTNGESITSNLLDLSKVDKYQLTARCIIDTEIIVEYYDNTVNEDQEGSVEFYNASSNVFQLCSHPKQRYARFILTNNSGSDDNEVSLEIKATYGSSDGDY